VVEVLDAAGGLFERVAEEVPNRAELRQRVDGLRAQHEGDSAVLEALEPALSCRTSAPAERSISPTAWTASAAALASAAAW